MSLSTIANADIQTILKNDGDTVTLTAPAELGGGIYSMPCQFIRRGMTRDVEGMGVISPAANITVSIAELALIGIADPESMKVKGWAADVGGISYRITDAPADYFVGIVTMILKRAA